MDLAMSKTENPTFQSLVFPMILKQIWIQWPQAYKRGRLLTTSDGDEAPIMIHVSGVKVPRPARLSQTEKVRDSRDGHSCWGGPSHATIIAPSTSKVMMRVHNPSTPSENLGG